MIPKVIHYCWFGHNPLPDLAKSCLASWQKFLPDYEIKEWNESNFDVNIVPYVQEAYEAKKYAFVSDYARFWILYHHGGIYFDTDVEVIRPMDDIIEKGAFMGCEMDPYKKYSISVNPGLGLGSPAGMFFFKLLLQQYETEHFEWKGTKTKTVVDFTTNLLLANGLENVAKIQCVKSIYIYPSDYFNPYNIITSHIRITENTRSIHRNAASWISQSPLVKLKYKIRERLPETLLLWYNLRPWKK